jgi:hypothetical protein
MTTQQPLDRFESELLAELRAVVEAADRAPVSEPPPLWRRPLVSVAGVAAAAATVVLATSVLGPGSTPSASAADLLLDAARSAVTAVGATDGTYWHVHSIESWDEGKLEGTLDEQLWQSKDGTVWASDNGQPVTEITGSGFSLCDKLVDYSALQTLPTDADALRAALVDATLHGDDGPVPADHRDSFVTDCTIGLLTLPVSPEVRGAAFRSLAALPDTENLGRTTDRQGRVGSGLAFGDGADRQRIVIDPDSGDLLQYDFAGEKGKRQGTVLESGWTDTLTP